MRAVTDLGPITRRAVLAGLAAAPLAAGGLDFARLIPLTVPRSAIYRDDGFHIWDPAMTRTPDGTCHLLYSRWPVSLGYDAWATSKLPAGPYRFANSVLTHRGAGFWDGHSVFNTCLLAHAGRYYLYYTGTRGGAAWNPDAAPSMKDEDWWLQRNAQRIGVAVADHPGGPWTRFDKPLMDPAPDTGPTIINVRNVIAKTGGGFLMVYKTLAPGDDKSGLHAFAIRWDDGSEQLFDRLEMPKLYIHHGRPETLFLAAKGHDDAPSFVLSIGLRDQKGR